MNQGRQANQFGRLAKVEFVKFHEDDVRGWVFRCDQFFHIDNTPNEEKVKIVSVYLSDKALLWHRQVTISQEHAISLYLGGLPIELQMSVRMFKPATLVDAYSLTRLQEAILEAIKKKSKPAGTFTSNRFGNGRSYGSVSKPALLPKPNTPNVPVNAHWLSTLGDIKFKELRMEFVYKNKKMVLRGTPKSNYEWMSNHRPNKVERQGKQPEFSSMQLCVYPSPEISLMKMEGYYRRFIKAYASISRRLSLLLKKNGFKWNAEAQSAFEQLKQAMISAPFKKGVENVSADALSRIQSKAQLFILFSNAPVNIELLHEIEATWEKDVELKTKIQKLKQGKHVKNSYVWTNQQLRRKGKLVVGKNDALRTALMTHFHSGSVSGSSGYSAQVVISMDFVEGLPKSQGKNVIMVVVDRLSKYSHFISLAHPFNAPQITQIFLDNIYKLYGFPKSIVSTRDKVFIGLLWKELFKLLQVKLLMSTAYHPQTDGQTEVVNRSLECYLRCMCGEKPKEWSKWLSLAEWWYNTNYHTTLNTTPYEVLYGQKPPIHIPYVSGESRVDTLDKTLIAREEVIQALRFHLKRTQDRMKMQANKNRSKREFIVVQAKIGAVAYKLILPDQAQIHDVFHVSQLKKCKGQQIAVGTLPQYDGNGLIQAQPVAILDRRLGKVGNAAGVFILVQWTNSDPEDATWESIEDIQKRFPEFNVLA
nr:retrotransposable element Tf2 [Tanacetum cinerariifolium]